MAMALLEDGFGDWNTQILGTDFSSQVLERARTGMYQQIEVNRGLPSSFLVQLLIDLPTMAFRHFQVSHVGV